MMNHPCIQYDDVVEIFPFTTQIHGVSKRCGILGKVVGIDSNGIRLRLPDSTALLSGKFEWSDLDYYIPWGDVERAFIASYQGIGYRKNYSEMTVVKNYIAKLKEEGKIVDCSKTEVDPASVVDGIDKRS